MAPTGWIQSPNYPNNYANDQDCTMVMTFENPPNMRTVVIVRSDAFSTDGPGDYVRFTDDGGDSDFSVTGSDLTVGNTVRCKFSMICTEWFILSHLPDICDL